MPFPFARVRIYDRLWLCGANTVAATKTWNNCLPQHLLHHRRQSQPAFRCALSTIPAMAAAAIVLGGKGSALSAEALYSVAHGKSKVQVDLSALQKMSNSAAAKSVYSQSKQNDADGTRFLSHEQSRAALVVLASKLLQSHVRPVIPLVIERALNKDMPLSLPVSNAGAAAAVAEMISSFRDGFKPGALDRVLEADLFVSIEEFNAMVASYCVTIGLAALSVYSSSVLSTVADAVSALSCEAVQVNVKGFELEASVEGFSNKSEIDVASDLRTLLFGSKLVTLKNQGFEGDSSFFSVAPIHGCLREDLKIAQSKVRIDLNSVPNYKRALQESTQLMSLEKTILSLAMSLKAVGEISLLRADQIAKVFILCGGPSALELFLQKQNSVDSLQSIVQSVISKAVISNGNVDAGCIATEVLDLVQHVSYILSLESVCCLSLIALRERMTTERGGQEPSIPKENAGNLGKQKGEKKKKGGREFVLGKGTNAIRQNMLNVFQNVLENHSDSVDFDKCLGASARNFCSFFEPKNSNLQIMLNDVKTILESNETRRLPKIPKGTRDFKPEQMAIRERAFSIIAGVFKRHGAVALDTPVFELRETLMGKYGEDSKLIFDLADQGGEICSLRYDLTVPFARYLAMHNISSLKRYHIARVYRRDNPSKGRYREFYQCDFDIAGPCATMVYDFEVIKVLTELLDELKIGDYEVKLNHRKLLDGMLELCGVPESKFRSICSAIDKLDKQPWDQVEKEMIDEKGLTPDVAKKIGSIVLKRGSPLEMLSQLKGEGSPFSQHSASLSTLEELETLFSFLEASGCLNKIVFDLSLARGLDYYTGVIYEAVFKGTTQVGSIAAGGRYDKLVGMFSGKQVPAVGVSLGIERVFTIMEQIEQENNNVIRATQTQVLLVVLGDDMKIAIRLVSELWSAKINAEFALTSSRKIGKHIEDALKAGIPYVLLLGENELKKGVVKLKDLREKEETEIIRDRIIDYLKSNLDANQVKDFVVVQ